jgi:hypothetical protein
MQNIFISSTQENAPSLMPDKGDVYHFFEQGQTAKQHFYLEA